MSGRLGNWWVGKEIEHTKFYGLDTMFFDTAEAFLRGPTQAMLERFPHFYFNTQKPNFFGDEYTESFADFSKRHKDFWQLIDIILGPAYKKFVTFEIHANSFKHERINALAKTYPAQILRMYRVTFANIDTDTFAIKVQNVYPKKSPGVYVMASARFFEDDLSTSWEAYKKDIPGKVYTKNPEAFHGN